MECFACAILKIIMLRNETKLRRWKKMKKMLIVLTALTVMGAGFVMAEDKKTETQKPSQAYMFGYNNGVTGGNNTCNNDYNNTKSPAYSQRTEDSFDCNQGYVQGKKDLKEISEQPKNKK